MLGVEDLDEPTHTLVPCWMPKRLPPRNRQLVTNELVELRNSRLDFKTAGKSLCIEYKTRKECETLADDKIVSSYFPRKYLELIENPYSFSECYIHVLIEWSSRSLLFC